MGSPYLRWAFSLARSGRPEAFDALRAILDEPRRERQEMILAGLDESTNLSIVDGLIKAREIAERGWTGSEGPFAARKRDFTLYRLRSIRESVRGRLDRELFALPDLSRR